MEAQEQTNNRPWLYKKGQSGNPGGRPKGSISMKTWMANKLSVMTEDEREEFLEGLNKIDILKMAEGNPKNESELSGKDGQPITIQISEVIALKNNINTNSDTDAKTE